MILSLAAVLAAIATPLATSLRGDVVDIEGKPVAGATVWLLERPHHGDALVVAEGRSDETGRFALERPVDLGDRRRQRPAARGSAGRPVSFASNPNGEVPQQGITLWAFRPGMIVAVRDFAEALPGPDQPVHLVLGRPAQTQIQVKGPDLHPISGARIKISRLKSGIIAIPGPLAERTQLSTGAQGSATLDAFAPEHVAEVEVDADGHGKQRCSLLSTKQGPKLVWLAPVAKVTGQLTADDPKVLRGWTIWAATSPLDNSAGADIGLIGLALVTADDRGRFEIPVIAEGQLTLSCRPPRDVHYRARAIPRTLVRADRANDIKVALDRAYRVEGTVVDRQSGAGIARVEITLNVQQTGFLDQCSSDDKGGFELYLLPGQYQLRLASLPRAYAITPDVEFRQINVAPGDKPATAEPFGLIRSEPPLRGRVVDESRRPVAGASIAGEWEMWLANYYGSSESRTTSDSGGNFELGRIPPLVEVKLSARRGSLATLDPVLVWPSEQKPATLRLARDATAAIRGRVVATDGRPVAGASIRVHARRYQGTNGWVVTSFDFDGLQEIRTDLEGKFQTPRELNMAYDYCIEAIADGFVSESSEFVKPAPGELNVLPDLFMRRALKLRTISGRVIDRQGNPLPKATVLQSGDGPRRSRSETDASGRFEIGGVADGPVCLFAEKPGCRFGGALVGAGDGHVDIVLDRTDERPARTLKSLPWEISRNEERALVRALIDPIAVPNDLRQRIPNNYQLAKVLRPLAWVDPPRLLAVLASPAIMRDESILEATAIALWELKGPGAVGMVDLEPDPCAKVYGLLALEKVAPTDRRELRIDLLTRAAREAARVTDPSEKVRLLGRAADRLRELGETDRTIPILREGWKVAQTLKRDQFGQSLAEFAPAMASTDLTEAVALVHGKNGSTPLMNNAMYANSILGEIAWRIAASRPAEAERLLTKINAAASGAGLERHLLRACARMAPHDLNRACKLAQSLAQVPEQNPSPRRRNRSTNRLGPGLALYAHLAVASAVAPSKPADARKQLEEAIVELRNCAMDEPGQIEIQNPACLIAGSLPLAEQVAPDRVEEYLWLALACRGPRGDEPNQAQIQTLSRLAALIARYDRAAALLIAQPVFDQVPVPSRTPFSANKWNGFETVFQGLACLDPHRASELIKRLPGDDKPSEAPGPHPAAHLGRAALRPARLNGAVAYPIESASRIQLAESLLLPIDRRRLDVENGIATPWLLDPAAEPGP